MSINPLRYDVRYIFTLNSVAVNCNPYRYTQASFIHAQVQDRITVVDTTTSSPCHCKYMHAVLKATVLKYAANPL